MDKTQTEAITPKCRYVLFILLITFLVYMQAVRYPFLSLDDTSFIVGRQYVHQWSSLPSFFTGMITISANDGLQISHFYRPMVLCWLLLNYKILGLQPALWHLSAILMYCLGVWLLWHVVWKLTRSDFATLAATAIYALHPLHVEGVVWISGAFVETLLSVFFLGSFLAYLQWRDNSRPLWLILCGMLLLCALLTKETAAALPVLIVAHAFLFRSSERAGMARGRNWVLPVITVTTTGCCYVLMRMAAIHAVIIPHESHSWGDVLRTGPLLYATYAKNTLWPVHLGAWYETSPIHAFTLANFWLPLLFCILYAALTVWGLRVRKPLAAFLLLWWAVLLGPAIAGLVAFADFEFVHDRFTFLALAAPAIGVAELLRRVPARGPTIFEFSGTRVASVALVMVTLAFLTTVQASTWKNEVELYAHDIAVAPRCTKARTSLASEFIKRHDFANAILLDHDAVAIDPNRWSTIFHYGMTLSIAGYREEGLRQLYRALELSPRETVVYYGLGAVLADAGDFDRSIRILQQGITVANDPATLRMKLASVEMRAQAAGQLSISH
jgi:protein O-mannosyl-transferase